VPSLNNAPDTGAQDNTALIGLRVKLRPCGRCQCISAHIGDGALLTCDSCTRTRGRLDHETRRFLIDFIAIFGRPTAPIEIRDSQTSLQPTGAGAETSFNRAER
jgi:hypothetical protein